MRGDVRHRRLQDLLELRRKEERGIAGQRASPPPPREARIEMKGIEMEMTREVVSKKISLRD
jgi:hypothetical protein